MSTNPTRSAGAQAARSDPDPAPRSRERRDARSPGSSLRRGTAGGAEPGPLLPQAEASALVAPFADLMTDAPVVAFAKDAAGRYVYANPYLLANLGDRLGEDWYGKTDAAIWPADVAARVRTADPAVIRGGTLKAFSNTLPFTDGPHDLLILKFPLDSRRRGLPGRRRDRRDRAREHAAASGTGWPWSSSRSPSR